VARIKFEFVGIFSGEFEVFASPPRHYRGRAEFSVFHDGEALSYAMNGTHERFVCVDECPKVSRAIYEFMPKLLEYIKKNANLKSRLFGVEFIDCEPKICAILLYHKDILSIENDLRNLALDLNINLIARSRGKKLSFCDEFFIKFDVDNRALRYYIDDISFIQPNRAVCAKMLEWANSAISGSSAREDLLEMYCGFGNFSLALSHKFRRVLANEISKSSINLARKNCACNNASNLTFLRMSAEELMDAFNGTNFNRLKEINLDDFNFTHVLVDPPRAGLSENVINFITKIPNIIYISCNPLTLKQNLDKITQTHRVTRFGIFDQFVNTNHVECGVLLQI